jgi:hypothetical protein
MAKRKTSHWMQNAVHKPGALHKDLGIPLNKHIPTDVLKKALKRGGKIAQRARFALNARGEG